MSWEGDVLLWIQDNLRNDVLDPMCKFMGYAGNHGELAIAVILLLVIIPKTRRTGFVCAVSLFIAYGGAFVLKHIFVRTRPYDMIEGLSSLVGTMDSPSFPSGHSASTFGCLIVILLMMPKKFGIPALCVSLFMGYSRLHVGVHYPTDVLVGAAIGIISAIICTTVYKKKFAPAAPADEQLSDEKDKEKEEVV